MIRCEFCGKDIPSPEDKSVWIRVTGWINNGKKAAPKFTGAAHGFAHDVCMKDKMYMDQAQPESLF